MAGRADIQAGSAFVRLFVKDDISRSLPKVLKAIGSGIATIAKTLVGLGTAAGAGMVAAATHFASAGSSLNDLSQRMGTSVENLSELKFAAEQSGASIEDLEKAFKFMAKKGIDVANFDKVAAEIAAIEDPTKRVAAAQEKWGKAGTKLLPMLKELPALRAEARALGIVPTADDIARADKLGDTFDKLKAVFSAALFRIGSVSAHILQPLLEDIIKIVGMTTKWVAENANLAESFKRIGEALEFDKLHLGFELALTNMKLFWLKFLDEIRNSTRDLIAGFGAGLFLPGAESLLEPLYRGLNTSESRNRVMSDQLSKRILELEKLLHNRPKLMDIPSPSIQDLAGEFGFANQKASTFTTGGAIALGFGGGAAGGVAKMTLEEIRKGNKARFEMLKELREIKARQAKPGIFK